MEEDCLQSIEAAQTLIDQKQTLFRRLTDENTELSKRLREVETVAEEREKTCKEEVGALKDKLQAEMNAMERKSIVSETRISVLEDCLMEKGLECEGRENRVTELMGANHVLEQTIAAMKVRETGA